MAATRDCAPCADCPPTPAPVMPRCNVVLPDGAYTNATVVVEDGCIIDVQNGALPVYTPESCCPDDSGGGGGDGLDGAQGPPGQNATIEIGTVSSLPSGATPTVANVGTPTAAILDFGIPAGADGADGAGAVSGVTSSTLNNTLRIENGLIKQVPAQWPPVMLIQPGVGDTVGAELDVSEDPLTGVVTLTLNLATFVTALTADFQAQIDNLQGQITALIAAQEGINAAFQSQLISLQTELLACCPTAELDLDGDGSGDPGGDPGVTPPPPVDPN